MLFHKICNFLAEILTLSPEIPSRIHFSGCLTLKTYAFLIQDSRKVLIIKINSKTTNLYDIILRAESKIRLLTDRSYIK